MSDFIEIKIPTFSEERGSLSVFQGELPFKIERIFWIYDSDDHTRGGHRHHQTRQILIAVKGHISIYMNDGKKERTIELTSPNIGLLVEPEDWHTMTFSKGSVLVVLASHDYNPDDYIDAPYE